jgi:hypothetical protein
MPYFVVLWNIAKPQEVISPNALEIQKNTAFLLTLPEKEPHALTFSKGL